MKLRAALARSVFVGRCAWPHCFVAGARPVPRPQQTPSQAEGHGKAKRVQKKEKKMVESQGRRMVAGANDQRIASATRFVTTGASEGLSISLRPRLRVT